MTRFLQAMRLVAALAGLVAMPALASAQRPLVYCPVGIDETGCAAVVTALGGADRAYDGSMGTVDLRTADLGAYTVLVIPSLADDGESMPYALLRDAAVAERLRGVLLGRQVFWSGTPDLGTAARADKDALIQRLAAWAAGNHAVVNAPGLMVLQDGSDDVGQRYAWIEGLTGQRIVADPSFRSYSSVSSLTAIGVEVIGGAAYDNMASLGFYLPTGASDISMDAVGNTGTSTGGQVVLMSAPGANTGGARVWTDKDDYAPGVTVTISGSGFEPGETITIVLHEDPMVHSNRTLTDTADASGSFVNTDFAPEEHDIGVRFILTATGTSSGRQAQTTFTDGKAALDIAPAYYPSGTTPRRFAVLVRNTDGKAVRCVRLTVPTNYSPPTVNLIASSAGVEGWGAQANFRVITMTGPELPSSGSTNWVRMDVAAAPLSGTATSAWQAEIYEDTGCTKNVSLHSVAVRIHSISGSQGRYKADFRDSGGNIIAETGVAGTSKTYRLRITNTSSVKGEHAVIAVPYCFGEPINVSVSRQPAGDAKPFTEEVTGNYIRLHKGELKSSTFVEVTFTTKPATTNPASDCAAIFWTAPWKSATPSTSTEDMFAIDGAHPTVSVAAAAPTSLVVSNASGTFGGTTNLSATLTVTASGAPVSGRTISFKINGTSVCGASPLCPTTDANGVASLSGVSLSGINAGTYNPGASSGVAASFAGDAAYAESNGSSVLAVAKAEVTATAGSGSGTYNGPAQSPTVCTVTGDYIGDLACENGPATVGPDVGTYTTTPVVSGTGLTNFNVRSVNGSYTIEPALVTATVEIPNIMVVYNGFPQSPPSGLPCMVTGGYTGDLTCANDQPSVGPDVGTYPIVPVVEGTGVHNFEINIVPGFFTIVPAQVTVIAGSGSGTYNGLLQSPTPCMVIGDAGYTGDLTCVNDQASVGPDAGTYPINPVINGPGAHNFDIRTVPGSYTIGQASVTATAGSGSGTYNGTAQSPAACVVTGAYTGDLTCENDQPSVGPDVGTYAITPIVSGPGQTNFAVATVNGSYTIEPAAVTATAGSGSGTYNGATQSASACALTGTYTGDLTCANDPASVGPNVGSYAITPLVSGTGQTNFVITPVDGSYTIEAAAVTGSITVADKEYDRTTSATESGRSVVGTIAGDAVSLTGGSVAFADKHVGPSKAVSTSGSFSLSGADAGNYSLGAVTANNAEIRRLGITGSYTAADKDYDGTTAAVLSAPVLSSALDGDDVALADGVGAFNNENAAPNKVVTVSGASLTGADAGNYSLGAVTANNAEIRRLGITGSYTAADKDYDGTTAAVLSAPVLSSALDGDAVALADGVGAFNNENAAPNKVVTVSGASLTGADAGNYSLGAVTANNAEIRRLGITGSYTAADKDYDGTTVAVLSAPVLSSALDGDDVALANGVGAFNNENAGTNKPVTVSGASLTGADAGNYTLGAVTANNAEIRRLGITGSYTAADKDYDGTTVAVLSAPVLSSALDGDDVALANGVGAFNNENAGTNKPVTVSAASLTGADAGNYTLGAVTANNAEIRRLGITGSYTAADKDYDGTTTATLSAPVLSSALDGDDVALANGVGAFNNENAGTNKPVTVSAASLTGADAGNYTLGAVTANNAEIRRLGITGSYTAADKDYDGTTTATLSAPALSGEIGGDDVALTGGEGSFSDENAAPNKVVTVSGASLTGADAGNYSLGAVTANNAEIRRLGITGSYTAADKDYDGTTVAVLSAPVLSSALDGDDVALANGVGAFNNENAGTNKPVTVSAASLTGADAGNYTLGAVTANNAEIRRLGITGSYTAANKVYDGTTAATITGSSITDGVIDGETVGISHTAATASFGDANAGTGKTVTGTGFTLTGSDMGNYVLNPATLTATADITPAPATITLSNLVQPFQSNTPRYVSYSTNPSNLTAAVVYTQNAGIVTAPTNVGVYAVTATVSGNYTGVASGFLVIYDPNGGFVTGGGWINSPEGAYVANPTLTDQARFGFLSKYQKGANTPTGQTEFQYRIGDLNFHSTVYEWLVVAGARAQYKGSGTINGSGDYGFMLSAVDGQVAGGGGTDKFRMKIWNKTTNVVVYDNMVGAADDAVASTVLGGGNIVIHAK